VGLIGRKSTAGLIGRAFIGRKSSPLPPSRAPISLPRPNPTGRRRRRISPPSRGSSPTSYAAWMASLVGAPVRRHGGRPAPRLRRQRRQRTGAGRPAAPARDGPPDGTRCTCRRGRWTPSSMAPIHLLFLHVFLLIAGHVPDMLLPADSATCCYRPVRSISSSHSMYSCSN
jgi:hypothetical protein